MSSPSRLALAVISLCATALVAHAAEQLVKPLPAATPKGGPTLAAAEQFCGEPSGKAEALLEKYSKSDKLSEVYRSTDYVAYGDSKDAASAMYTFTTKTHAAHPAAVCRKIVQEGDNLVVKMMIVCEGPESDCNKLRNDFNVMTAKMQADVNQKIADQKNK